jgi:hypothetical protein
MKNVAILGICVLVGIFLSFFLTSGILVRWEQIPSPSQYESEVFASEQNTHSPTEMKQSCAYSTIEFSIFSNTPKDPIECVQIIKNYGDGYGRFAYVRDREGNIWNWSYISSMSATISGICWPIIGFIIGIIIINIRRSEKTHINADDSW